MVSLSLLARCVTRRFCVHGVLAHCRRIGGRDPLLRSMSGKGAPKPKNRVRPEAAAGARELKPTYCPRDFDARPGRLAYQRGRTAEGLAPNASRHFASMGASRSVRKPTKS